MLLTQEFSKAMPEVILIITGLITLMIGAFTPHKSKLLYNTTMLGLALALITALYGLPVKEHVGFYGLFLSTPLTQLSKGIIVFSVMLILAMGYKRHKDAGLTHDSLFFLILMATAGMMLMVSCHDMVSLYIAIELQSFPLYILVAMNRKSVFATEAGIKYFVLGSVSSVFLLFGASLVYGYTGSTEFTSLLSLLDMPLAKVPFFVKVGMVGILMGLAFKLSLAPFHIWTPDVYQGSPTPITAFLAGPPKIAALLVWMRVTYHVFYHQKEFWQYILQGFILLSLIIGSVMALRQTSFKRLLAYSTITQVGFMMMGPLTGTVMGVHYGLVYSIIYLIATLGIFTCLHGVSSGNTFLETLDDMRGLGKQSPFVGGSLAVFMFSLAGVPPLAGFFGKFFVLKEAISQGFTFLVVVSVLASVIAAAYYLKIIKVLFFEDPSENQKFSILFNAREPGVWILGITLLFTLVFLFIPNAFFENFYEAAQSLFRPLR